MKHVDDFTHMLGADIKINGCYMSGQWRVSCTITKGGASTGNDVPVVIREALRLARENLLLAVAKLEEYERDGP